MTRLERFSLKGLETPAGLGEYLPESGSYSGTVPRYGQTTLWSYGEMGIKIRGNRRTA